MTTNKITAHNSALELIGNTPLVRLNQLTKDFKGDFYAKVEAFNPGHSNKDRIAIHIIEQEELQNLFRSIGVRAIDFKKFGLKSSLGLFVTLGERLLSNILLRAEQGADSLMSRQGLWLSSEQLRPNIVINPKYLWVNISSIFLLFIAISLRCLYGTS